MQRGAEQFTADRVYFCAFVDEKAYYFFSIVYGCPVQQGYVFAVRYVYVVASFD